MSKESVAVRIAGHNYKILSDGDADSLREIARYVDAAMDRVRQRTGTVDTLDISVLTCLNLAREIVGLRAQTSDSMDDGRLRGLIERVEIALGGESVSASERAQDDAVTEGSSAKANESARTLDLPSVETLPDRTKPAAGERTPDLAEEALPTARVASGGRKRSS
jgi:cell division protein ZapA (FtsZ GTPase activity inhibitor)